MFSNSKDRTRLRIGLRTGLILIMKMERLLEAAKVKLEEAKSRRACRGAASLCSKALAMDEKEQFPERAEFDAVIRKAEQKARESSCRRCPIRSATRSLGTTAIAHELQRTIGNSLQLLMRPHFQHLG